MPNIQRQNDKNNANGAITNTASNTTVFANGLLVAVNGSTGTSDNSCNNNNIHCGGNWQTAGGCPTVFAQGSPVNFTGNLDTCGHVRVGGSGDVFLCS